MILAISCGNTNTKFAIFDSNGNIAVRCQAPTNSTGATTSTSQPISATNADAIAKEYYLTLIKHANLAGVSLQSITKIAIASVVPVINCVFDQLAQKYLCTDSSHIASHIASHTAPQTAPQTASHIAFQTPPLNVLSKSSQADQCQSPAKFVQPTIQSLPQTASLNPIFLNHNSIPDIQLDVTEPNKVGIDRLIGSYYGLKVYKTNVILIDFGTATTFNVVLKNGVFFGGIICAGVDLCAKALHNNTSALPLVALKEPVQEIIGKNTESAIKSGLYFGHLEMVNGIIDRIKASQLEKDFKVLATGGFGKLMYEGTDKIDEFDENLVLKGIYYLCTH